jgi:DHA1 family multidrug resistance protein-like MFS transporter
LALLFCLSFAISAMVPLLPRFVDRFGLSTVAAGALLSVLSILMLATSVPIGMLADRTGPRRLVLAGVAGLAVSSLMQGLASNYWMLLGGRGLLGLADATALAAALVWLSNLGGSARSRAVVLGASVTVGGAGFSLGPLVIGATTDRFGTFVPFAAIAGVALLVGVLLARQPSPAQPARGQPPRLRDSARAAHGEPYVLAALLLMVTSGSTMISFALLIPLRLHANGLTAGQIGAVFSLFGTIGVIVGVIVNRLGERAAHPRVGAFCVAWLALADLLPAANQSTTSLLTFLALSSWASTTLITIPYPIGAAGARRAGIAPGAIMGSLNTSWALSATSAPLVGGLIAQTAGDQTAWLSAAGLLALGALLTIQLTRKARTRE